MNKSLLESSWVSFRITLRLALNNFLNRYRASYFGLFWTVLYPFTTVIIQWFIFTQAFKMQPPRGNVPFFIWLLAGTAAWNFFAESMTALTSSVTGSAYMLKKRSFNLALLPLISLLSSFFSHCVFLGICLAVFLFYGIFPAASWLQLPYYMFCLGALGFGLGLFTAAASVFVPDIQNLVQIFLQLFFWVTPVFWSVDMLPEKYAFFLRLNPVAYTVRGYRDALLGQGRITEHGGEAAYFWAFTLAALAFSSVIFKKLKPHFADVL